MDKNELEKLHKEILRLQNITADMYMKRDMTGFKPIHDRLARLLMVYKKETGKC